MSAAARVWVRHAPETSVASPPNSSTFRGDGAQSLAGSGPLGQDADTIAQIRCADLLQLTPDRRPLARGLGGDGVDEQQPRGVHQSISTPNDRSTREGFRRA